MLFPNDDKNSKMKFRIGNIFLFLYFKYFSFLSSNLMTRVMINDATEKLKRSDDISAYLTLINIPACILKILAQKFHKIAICTSIKTGTIKH